MPIKQYDTWQYGTIQILECILLYYGENIKTNTLLDTNYHSEKNII